MIRYGLVAAALLAALAACRSPAHHRVDVRALGPYSGSVGAGDLVFLSGKVGSQRDGSFEEEVASALDAVEAELDRAALDLEDLVSVTVFLTDMAHYDAFNAVYSERVPEPWPARTCVAVAALPGGARVEIRSVAWRSP